MLLWIFVIYAVLLSIALRIKGRHPAMGDMPSSSRRTNSPARLLVVGASGGTGRHLVSQALERGYKVTALVRDRSSLDTSHPNLTLREGDVLQPQSLDEAVEGQDAVVSALGHKQFFRPTRILSHGTQNLMDAMNKAGIRRLVCVSALGIGSSVGRLGLYYTLFVIPVILPFYFWDKTRQEKAIMSSNLDWTIVRPGALTDGSARGEFKHGSNVGNFLWTVRIARADTASFVLDQLTNETYLRQASGVCW